MTIVMTEAYAVLAPIYEKIGLAGFTAHMTPRLLQYAQSRLDWIGRRVLDLGCGTGVSARWLATHGMNVTAIDQSQDMLTQAVSSISTSGLGLSWKLGDARSIELAVEPYDIAFAFGLMNDLAQLRDVEAVIVSAHNALDAGKLFVFDLQTMEGLAKKGGQSEMLYEDDETNIFAQHDFDYERLALVSRCVIYRSIGEFWGRDEVQLTVRGYSVQAVAGLLRRIGFSISALVTPLLETHDPNTGHADRVIFFARKHGGSN